MIPAKSSSTRRGPRLPWVSPVVSRLDAANAELGLLPINPEGMAKAS